jgi:hypothetical protein
MVNKSFLNKNRNNAATNLNSENARSRMVASSQGSMGMGQREMSQVLGAFGLLDFLARILKLMKLLFL